MIGIVIGGYMKKLLIFLFLLFFAGLACYASEMDEVQDFFNRYVEAANSYDTNYFSFYADDAKIIRVVEKGDGSFETVNIPLERYKSEAKKSKALMKLRKYKNFYSNIKILPVGKNYKISALRQPSLSDYKIPAHFIIGKDDYGNWKIKEESMNTRVKAFLTKKS